MVSFCRVLAAPLLALFILATSAFAWKDDGHMAVAYVAYKNLDKLTRDRANALLRLNPYYKRWESMIPEGTSPDDQVMMTFMIAATWPDEIKAPDSGYKNDPGSPNGDVPGPNPTLYADANIGYEDKLYHKYWHFVDRPFSDDGTQLPPIPSPNAQTQIARFQATLLSSSAADSLKSYDLVWLMH
jgi:hypothetical protein